MRQARAALLLAHARETGVVLALRALTDGHAGWLPDALRVEAAQAQARAVGCEVALTALGVRLRVAPEVRPLAWGEALAWLARELEAVGVLYAAAVQDAPPLSLPLTKLAAQQCEASAARSAARVAAWSGVQRKEVVR